MQWINQKAKDLSQGAIRAMFEEGKKMAAKYGADHVYDFSLGNPNVPAPAEVKDAIIDIVTNEDPVLVHGYMNNSGYEDVRETLAEHLNSLYGTSYGAGNLLMTVGAAGGLNVIFKTLLNPGDEVVTMTPYFGEYRVFSSPPAPGRGELTGPLHAIRSPAARQAAARAAAVISP